MANIVTRLLLLAWAIMLCAECVYSEDNMSVQVPEFLYKGEMVSFPGAWAFHLPKSHIILVSDEELVALSNPDAKLDMSPWEKEITLRQICERAKTQGARTMILAFDHFFSQYRPGQDKPRRLTPDMDEYVDLIAKISKFAENYGLGLELSLLSPLEIGPAYVKATGESGQWLHYRKGLRDPKTGAFDVQMWKQTKWANNKGVINPEDAGVRVFAFREDDIYGTPYRAVDPESIVEITEVAKTEDWESITFANGHRMRVYGRGRTDIGDLNRVLVVQQYRTPEMDYFSAKAQPYLTNLIDKYADAGVKLNALYSDEMHIQQDWNYFGHHDNGEFTLRYMTDNMAAKYAQLYGEQYRDFAKYMIYFVYGQEDIAPDLNAKQDVMHVFGASPEKIRETALFRARYYHLLQDTVTDLFTSAKRHAEKRFGHRLESRAHATWAESPTIDCWRVGREDMNRHKYEYTSNFVWSDTVHQAAAACYDYFKWGDFLTGNGNDTAEGGWLDRNYYALALACSTGILNEVPQSYAACWGVPHEINHRRHALNNAYGAMGSPLYGMVQDMQHRDVDVMMLYPIDLVAVEERFGSWVNQYGYANQITQAKLLERGTVNAGVLEVAGRKFTTLVATFEPFPSKRLLDMMRQMVEGGGRVVWSGPPPVLSAEGGDALKPWMDIFGVDYVPGFNEGILAPGKQVTFEGVLKDVSPQIIMTDFIVDRIYPVTPREGTEAAARVKNSIVGTYRKYEGGGTATFLGYRPRDDQSASLGYETRNWFEVLNALGAYGPTGKFPGVNDNTEYLSRNSDYLFCRFPNGAVAVAPHLRTLEEDWEGGFIRNEESDKKYIEQNPPPSQEIHLKDAMINGHKVTFDGVHALTFRVDSSGNLVAFAGAACKQITIDGRTTVFADADISTAAWAPIPEDRRVEGGAVWLFMAYGTGKMRIPTAALPATNLQLFAQGPTPGSRGEEIPTAIEGGSLVFEVTQGISGRWIYGVPR